MHVTFCAQLPCESFVRAGTMIAIGVSQNANRRKGWRDVSGWYYRKSGIFDDETIGPITDEDFLLLAYDGELKLGTFVTHPTRTQGQWTTASQIPAAKMKLEEGTFSRRKAKEDAASERARQKAEKKASAAEWKQQRLRAREAEREAQEAKRQAHEADVTERQAQAEEEMRRQASNASLNFGTDFQTDENAPETHDACLVPPALPTETPSKSRKKRLWVAIVALVFVLTGGYATFRGSRVSINPLQSLANAELQAEVNQIIESDYRNAGIDVSAYYRDTFSKSVVVFDLQGISGTNSRLDVFRVFLDFAAKRKDSPHEAIELAFRGKTKFKLAGEYFETLGREREFQNVVYTIRSFPQNLTTPSGLRAYPEWTGGLIGVLNKGIEDFNDFHDKWYLDELLNHVP